MWRCVQATLHSSKVQCPMSKVRAAEQTLDLRLWTLDAAPPVVALPSPQTIASKCAFPPRRSRPEPLVFRLAPCPAAGQTRDRKSTRLNSSHVEISYAVFC